MPIQVTPEEEAIARKTFMDSAIALGNTENEVKKIRPADWTEAAQRITKYAINKYNELRKISEGKMGNLHAICELEGKWFQLYSRGMDLWTNPPGWLRTGGDKVALFLTDFLRGAEEAFYDYVEMAFDTARPALKRYWDLINHLNYLKEDLEKAKKSGQFTDAEIRAQENTIVDLEGMIDGIRVTFKALSGGTWTIDGLAQQEFGSFEEPSLGVNVVPWPVAAIALAAVVGIILVAYEAGIGIKGMFPSGETAPWVIIAVVGVVAGILVLPQLIKD